MRASILILFLAVAVAISIVEIECNNVNLACRNHAPPSYAERIEQMAWGMLARNDGDCMTICRANYYQLGYQYGLTQCCCAHWY